MIRMFFTMSVIPPKQVLALGVLTENQGPILKLRKYVREE